MLLSQLTWNLSGTSAFLISLSLLVNIPFSNSLGSNTWGDKMADWHSCFTIVDRSLIRERVQNYIGIRSRRCRSIGCRFFPIPFSVGTEWNRISNGSKFFIRPIISRSHQILTYICQRLSIKGLKSSVTLRYWQKLYTAMFMSTKAKHEWLSFQCTNRLGKTTCLSSF